MAPRTLTKKFEIKVWQNDRDEWQWSVGRFCENGDVIRRVWWETSSYRGSTRRSSLRP